MLHAFWGQYHPSDYKPYPESKPAPDERFEAVQTHVMTDLCVESVCRQQCRERTVSTEVYANMMPYMSVRHKIGVQLEIVQTMIDRGKSSSGRQKIEGQTRDI